jgi:hypothetical protein
MSNEPVDTGTQMEGPDELEEQQESSVNEPKAKLRRNQQNLTRIFFLVITKNKAH